MKDKMSLLTRRPFPSPRFLFGAATLSILVLVPGACSDDAEDCHQLKTCGGASGAGGTSGGGASGTSGTSGTAGEAGMSGGDGGAAGSGIGGTSGATGGGSGSAGESGAGGAGGGETPCDPTMGPSEGRLRDRRGVRCVRLARR